MCLWDLRAGSWGERKEYSKRGFGLCRLIIGREAREGSSLPLTCATASVAFTSSASVPLVQLPLCQPQYPAVTQGNARGRNFSHSKGTVPGRIP